MRINIEKQNEFQWHTWYAWHPVKVPLFEPRSYQHIYKYQWVWLERLEKKYIYTSSQDVQWVYKIIDKQCLKTKTKKIRLVAITITKEDYKEKYSLRGRIGIAILRILGVATLTLK